VVNFFALPLKCAQLWRHRPVEIRKTPDPRQIYVVSTAEVVDLFTIVVVTDRLPAARRSLFEVGPFDMFSWRQTLGNMEKEGQVKKKLLISKRIRPHLSEIGYSCLILLSMILIILHLFRTDQ
jgi:hypothetical protein